MANSCGIYLLHVASIAKAGFNKALLVYLVLSMYVTASAKAYLFDFPWTTHIHERLQYIEMYSLIVA
jgi:hypothetical protein